MWWYLALRLQKWILRIAAAITFCSMAKAGENECGPPLVLVPQDDWMEMEVIMGFRVWQLMFLALAGLITVVVLLCCFMKCRVPRTKQEIEADFKRKEITRRFRFLLDKVQIEDTSLRTAIEKVNEVYMDREKMKRRKKKKLEDEEEIVSAGSSYLFEDEKLTIIERIKNLLGLLKDDASDSESDSIKEKSDKSEEIKPAVSEDELSKVTKLEKTQSEESADSPQLHEAHSKSSLLHDTPAKTHDTLSRLSIFQDSPPNYGISLLQDTPPQQRKSQKETSSDSQESAKKRFGTQKTESQESNDSAPSTKKQDSQDSDKSIQQKSSDSQDSWKQGSLKNSKRDSQDSEETKRLKEKSDSQESSDSDKMKMSKESEDSKLIRRESIIGHSSIHKWGKKSSNPKSNTTKATKSLDINGSSTS